MPNTVDPSLRGLTDCEGCEGSSAETPLRVTNPAGLEKFSYRVGTHARFLESMLARLSTSKYPALSSLKTRSSRDLTIAFLDACAAVDDGLTFYTERYAHEWYVRTAKERVSLVQLARLIGYEPRPGVAASTHLSFAIEDTPGTPEKTTIPAGVRVMSIPGKDELPQVFETSAAIEARSTWNAMKVRTRQPQDINTDMQVVIVRGIESSLKRGDSLLIVTTGSSGAVSGTEVKRIKRVVQEPAAGQTLLELQDAPTPSAAPFTFIPMVYTPSLLNNTVFDSFLFGQSFSSSDINILGKIYGWSAPQFTIAANTPKPTEAAVQGVYALRQRAAIFGHNAPNWASLPQIVSGQTTQITGRVLQNSSIDDSLWQYPQDWDDLDLADAPNPGGSFQIDLDNVYPGFTENSWIVLESNTQAASAYRVAANQELTRNDFTLSVKVTRLSITNTADSNPDDLDEFKMRGTTVYGQSEQLALADIPVTGVVSGKTVVLDKYYDGLYKGQAVMLTGERVDPRGVIGHEARILEDAQISGEIEPGRYFTVLHFTQELEFEYLPETVTINANVVAATHGETKEEVLGSGDGARRYQSFTLKQRPLTYTSAATPSGAQSSLEVRINDVLWSEASSLYGRRADERVYAVHHEDDGRTWIQFNAPLPTGQENVRAKYRVGIGLPGLVKEKQLSLLAVKPLGVRSVANPLAASGAEDREALEDLRQNSPLTVLTLDRLVSLLDYQDFARAFAGFSKALATPTSDGSQRGVFLTVAGETGAVSESSQEFTNLVSALNTYGDPFVSVVVKPYRPAFFQVEGTLGIDPAYQPDLVAESVKAALQDKFSFTRRQFGQPVTQVEVISTMQNLPGVVFVNLAYLFKSDPFNPSLPKSLQSVLPAELPEPQTSRFTALAAELLIIDPRPIQLVTVVT